MEIQTIPIDVTRLAEPQPSGPEGETLPDYHARQRSTNAWKVGCLAVTCYHAFYRQNLI